MKRLIIHLSDQKKNWPLWLVLWSRVTYVMSLIFRSACTLYTSEDTWPWCLWCCTVLSVNQNKTKRSSCVFIPSKHPVLPAKTGSVAVSYMSERERKCQPRQTLLKWWVGFLIEVCLGLDFQLLSSHSCISVNKVRCCDSQIPVLWKQGAAFGFHIFIYLFYQMKLCVSLYWELTCTSCSAPL